MQLTTVNHREPATGRRFSVPWPASVLDRTADFGSARRGSIPRRATAQQHVLEVCRIARDSAMVEDQVRPLARTLSRRWSQTARQPAATRSKWVRLPPASLTIQLPVQTTCRKCEASELFLRWMVLITAQLPVGTTSTPCQGVPNGTMSRQPLRWAFDNLENTAQLPAGST